MSRKQSNPATRRKDGHRHAYPRAPGANPGRLTALLLKITQELIEEMRDALQVPDGFRKNYGFPAGGQARRLLEFMEEQRGRGASALYH